MSEVLNVLRLIMSRLGSHRCPNGHMVAPSVSTQRDEISCPECGVTFVHPSAESFAFNSGGACPACTGLGQRSEVDIDALVQDPDRSIRAGAVLPWTVGTRRLSALVAEQLGVRLDVPYRELTERERAIVLTGEPVRRTVTISTRAGRRYELDVMYDNAVTAARRAADSTSERVRQRAQTFLKTRTCSVCHGTRLRPEALTSRLAGCDLAQLSALDLQSLNAFGASLVETVTEELLPMARTLLAELAGRIEPMLDSGLGYLGLDRAGASLSTGERQRIALTSTIHSGTTGMLYVLDEPSVGLHPSNAQGLIAGMRALVANGNCVVVVEHDLQIIRDADWVIEMGPGAGRHGGTVVAQGSPRQLTGAPGSIIGPLLSDPRSGAGARTPRAARSGHLSITVNAIHNLSGITARFPLEQFTAVAGPSGAGKTALVIDSLVPAALARLAHRPLPRHVRRLSLEPIRRVVVVDATPIGLTARSTPATYSGALDLLRRRFAATPDARRRRWAAGHFSFNTKAGQCPTCRGLGRIDLDVQYLPDIDVVCPTCRGSRFNEETLAVRLDGLTIADVLSLTIDEALERFQGDRPLTRTLAPMADVGLAYLRLGEPTPSLSGGEAQRLRIAQRLGSRQAGTLYVLDEPSTGLHPRDVQTLIAVLDRLLADGATVIVIDHDLDLIAAADHVIDLGPGGGTAGGQIIAQGTPREVAADPHSITGPWLAERLT